MSRPAFLLPAIDRRGQLAGTWVLVGGLMARLCGAKPRYLWVPLALLLTACATHQTAPGWAAPIRPPAALTEPVTEPPLPDPLTNGSLAEWADELRAALREANRRIKAIRDL